MTTQRLTNVTFITIALLITAGQAWSQETVTVDINPDHGVVELENTNTLQEDSTEDAPVGTATVDVDDGEVVELVASGKGLRYFVEWTGADVPAGQEKENPLTITGDGVTNFDIGAVFAFEQLVELQAIPDDEGQVRIRNEDTADEEGWADFVSTTTRDGHEIRVRARPRPGSLYEFLLWEGDLPVGFDETDHDQTFLQDTLYRELTAVFAPWMRLEASANGRVQISGGPLGATAEELVRVGSTAEINADPDPGFYFVRWEGDIPPAQANTRSPTITQQAEGREITAVFAPIPSISLGVSGSGQVRINGGPLAATASEQVMVGDTAEIHAEPAAGFYFVRWEGDISDAQANIRSPTITQQAGGREITAVFRPLSVITVSSSNPARGTVSITNQTTGASDAGTSAQIEADEGDDIRITADPGVLYRFEEWTGDIPDGLEESNPANFEQGATSRSIVANFRRNPTISVTVNDADYGEVEIQERIGGVWDNIDGPADEVFHDNVPGGTRIRLIATAFPETPWYDYEFVGWEGDIPEGQQNANPAIFTQPEDFFANRDIVAIFRPRPKQSLRINILPFGHEDLEGVGTGTVLAEDLDTGETFTYVPQVTSHNWLRGARIRLTAQPGMVPNPGLGGDFQSFVFEWGENIPESLAETARPHPLSFSIQLTEEDAEEGREISILFSREYHPGEGVGDLDLDGLPDRWEIRHGLDPKDPTGDNGAQGNPSGDFMPGDWAPGGMNRFASGQYPAALGDLNTNWPYRFPATGTRPENYYFGVIPFNNWFQARGFDGWYGRVNPNPITGLDDRPRTDPNLLSTAGDGISDGWKYFFYGSILNDYGITQLLGDPPNLVGTALGAYTDPNNPVPTIDIDPPDMLAIFQFELEVDPSADPDNDCVTLMEEFLAGTDPFHWDTDGDLISDGYELRMGLDPLDPADANDNDSGDYMAFYEDEDTGEEFRHGQVYDELGFDPRTGWGENYYSVAPTRTLTSQPNTIPFTNLEHYRASVYLAAREGTVLNCENWEDFALNPLSIDTDDDGIFDGWELYVGLNPLSSADASAIQDGDGLTNFQEFSCYDLDLIHGGTWPNGRSHFDPVWRNKVWPTDPNEADTDGDGLSDGAQGGYQNVPGGIGNLAELKYAGDVVNWTGRSYAGGGLNPTAVDTDGDGLPDHWEARFRSSVYDINDLSNRNGMDPTIPDAQRDYDGDGLLNYQEYLVGAVHHWRYRPDTPFPDQGLPPGAPLGSHDPMMFLTGVPFEWDPGAVRGSVGFPYFFIEHINDRYNSTDPTNPDSDGDGIDDYWKIYHGLNPTYGRLDLFSSMHLNGTALAGTPPTFDIRILPFAAGYPYADPDQDGLPNWAEAIQPDDGPPYYYHTDPSPLWVTDVSYQRSWVNLYYAWNPLQPWYFDSAVLQGADEPPTYMFSFAVNEGFDTDGDFVGDRAELVSDPSSPGVSDPLSVETPARRGALYLEGNSAARTRAAFFHESTKLRSFTIEAWVRPVNPASGQQQIIIERPMYIPSGNIMGVPAGIRYNFRLGLNEDGVPFAAYNGGGFDTLFIEATAPSQAALKADRWSHVAAVYNGATRQFQLFVNGQLRRTVPNAERPFNGWVPLGDGLGRVTNGPMVIGAADENPRGWVTGTPVQVGPDAGLVQSQPDLHSHFHGWVDEVRVWNGSRTLEQIEDNADKAMTMQDVQASLDTANELMYLYNFNSLHDPLVERVAPDGFDLLNGRPNDGSYPHVPWWGTANDRSVHYDNYHYVPWIPNIAARLPLDPPADSPISRSEPITEVEIVITTNIVVEVDDEGEEVESEVVTTNEVVTVIAEGVGFFPNTANPYNMAYYHRSRAGAERHPELRTSWDFGFTTRDASIFNDLLPLGQARADVTVELWDGLGEGGPVQLAGRDSNNDGIPDEWYIQQGRDPADDSVADENWDGTGLSNYWQYRLGADPYNPYSLWEAAGSVGPQLDDGQFDYSNDGLSNLEKVNLGLNPAVRDTDDDGVDDIVELEIGTDPLDDLSPFVLRYLENDGLGHVEVPATVPGYDVDGARFDLEAWTVEAMVYLNDAPLLDDVILIQRRAQPFGYVTFELGIQAADRIPYVHFQSPSGRDYYIYGIEPVPLEEWMMLGARFGYNSDIDRSELSFFQNGARVRQRVLGLDAGMRVRNATGVQDGPLVLARDLNGRIDEVRIWNGAIPERWIESNMSKTLLFGRDSVFQGGLAPDGGRLVFPAEPSHVMDGDFTLRAWVRSAEDGTVVERRSGTSPHDGSTLYNYRLRVENGEAVAYLTALYSVAAGEDCSLPPTVERWATHRLSGGDVVDGDWHHLALVHEDQMIRLLVDGTVVDQRSIATAVGANWHLLQDEQACTAGSFLQLATILDSVRVGEGFTDAFIVEVGLNDEAFSAQDVAESLGNLIDTVPSLRMYLGFDFIDPDETVVPDQANPNVFGELLSGANVSLAASANAPVEVDNRMVLAGLMAGYFHMNDGGETIQDGVAPRDARHFDSAAGVMVNFSPGMGVQDIVPQNMNFGDFADEPQLAYPVFFPLPPDSPYRLDSDGDGMPDVFEAYFFGLSHANDIVMPGQPQFGPWGDLSGNGLPNIYEYWAGTDPRFWSSRGDGVSDADFDSDGDGLSNYEEFLRGTHPGRRDTDNDGFEDGDELNPLLFGGVSNPADSMDPIIWGSTNPRKMYKSLHLLAGADRFQIPRPIFDLYRFNAEAWTIETWFRPSDAAPQTGTLIEYVGTRWNNHAAEELVFYRLGVDDNVPYVEMQTAQADADPVLRRVELAPITGGEWAHLAATFDPDKRTLRLYRDGLALAALEVQGVALSGGDTVRRIPGRAYIGSTGLRGHLDDTRIWSYARTHEQVLYGSRTLVQANEPGLIAYFRYDDGRQGDLDDPGADGFGANDGRGAEDFANRISSSDLETAWAYSLRGVVFDHEEVSLRAGAGFDDKDGDGIADYWENLYFSRIIDYYPTRRDPFGNITETDAFQTRINADEDYANSLYMLGWSIDFSPLESVAMRRLWERPDAAYYLKSFQISDEPQYAELRMIATVPNAPESRRFWVNGVELDLTDPRIQGSGDTFDPPDGANTVTWYIPAEMITPLLQQGHNRMAVYMVNDNGNENPEYVDLQLLVDGQYYIRKSEDSLARTLDRRWWVFGTMGSLAEPPLDAVGREWFEVDYGYDGDQDPDGDGLLNKYEQWVRTNPLDADSNKDGILDPYEDFSGDGLINLLEQEYGTDPRLWDTSNNGFSDFQEVENHTDPLSSLSPLTNRVLDVDGDLDTYVRFARDRRFALTDWVVEAWVHPRSRPVAGELAEIIARTTQAGRFNYFLGMNSEGHPVAQFTSAASGQTITISPPDGEDAQGNPIAANLRMPLGEWTHVRAGFNHGTGRFFIEVDGVRYDEIHTGRRPDTSGIGPIETRVGRGFDGFIDEVRIWSAMPSTSVVPTLATLRGGLEMNHADNPAAYPLTGNEDGLVGYLRFDDGVITTTHPAYAPDRYPHWTLGVVQDFAAAAGERQWERAWLDSARIRGNAQVLDSSDPLVDGAPTDVIFAIDLNNDGIPDWWQDLYWPDFDPHAPGPNPWDPMADPDGDGLWNITEYLAGLDPTRADTYGDGVLDGFRDADGDGLNNLFEQNVSGTRVDLVDTDDDGLTDWEEVTGQRVPVGWQPGDSLPPASPDMVSDPLSSLDPRQDRALRVGGPGGPGHVRVNDQQRHALRSWTLQAWVNPEEGAWNNDPDGHVLIRRRVYNPLYGHWEGVNYELGVRRDADGFLAPYARYIGLNPANGTPLPVELNGTTASEIGGGQLVANRIREDGEWTHVAATYNPGTTTLRIYIDGDLALYRNDAHEPWGLGVFEDRHYRGEVTIGGAEEDAFGDIQRGFDGYMDDVMILAGSSNVEAVRRAANRADSFTAALRAHTSPSSYAPRMVAIEEALEHEHAAGRMLVRFQSNVAQAQVPTLAQDLGIQSVRQFRIVPVHLMEIADGESLADKLAVVRAHPDVLYAEPDYRVHTSRTPNDPMFDSQWALRNTGQTGGTPGADISAEQAWATTTGSPNTLMAVIDSGIDYTHADLAGNMWPGIGHDFIVDVDDPMDDNGHGTHVAGTIGAVGNNALGIAGVNWQIQLMGLRFLGATGSGSTSGAIAAIEYAWMNGVRVSNNSWGSYGYSQALFDAIQMAGNAGHLFIAAAGNFNFDNDILPYYPASYNLPNIISVASMDHNGIRSSFSNYGVQSVHLAAPGQNILSTMPGQGYGSMSGTSMAAPHVAGVAGLILAQNPSLHYQALRQIILQAVDPSDYWADWVMTGGTLNAARAVGIGTPVLYFSFNDGGSRYDDIGYTVEDYTVAQDWNNNWYHAGRFVGNADFDGTDFFRSDLDSNNDGIPDWWYEQYGFDPLGPSIAHEDPDGDGLINLYEYLAGTHPLMPDSNMNGTSDALEDANNDGMTNLQKQQLGLHPLLSDTDDDGISDVEEVATGTDPLDPNDPEQFGAVSFGGNGRLLVRTERDIDAHLNWTVEAWVRPENNNVSGIILRRAERFPNMGVRWVDYELGLDNNVPYITYTYRRGSTPVTERIDALRPIEDVWTHVAAVMDNDVQDLRLYVNGKRVDFEGTRADYLRPIQRPAISAYGAFMTTIGGGDEDAGNIDSGFRGEIDAVRIWDYARTSLEVQMHRGTLMPEFVDGLPDSGRAPIRLFNFNTRGQFAHNSRYPEDWRSGHVGAPEDLSRTWLHAAQFEGDAEFVDADWPPATLDTDDDGISDQDEHTQHLNAQRSEIPLRYQYLSFDASQPGDVLVEEYIDGEETRHFALTNWTVEAWVRPVAPALAIQPGTRMPLVRRQTATANPIVTFELGVVEHQGALVPYTRFQRDDSGNAFVTLTYQSQPLPFADPNDPDPEDWTHLAATFDNGRFSLYVDGARVQQNTGVGANPYVGSGGGVVLLGSDDFTGHLQEVRIWNHPRTREEISAHYRDVLLFSSALQESSFEGGDSYLGRNTADHEDGLSYDHTVIAQYEDVPYIAGRDTHKFTVQSWVKMDPGSSGGIVAERKIDVLFDPDEPDWRINHSLRITDQGHPQGFWQGQVVTYTPVREDVPVGEGDEDEDPPTENRVVRLDQALSVVGRNITSEVDIRDGQWHHLALVGDSRRIRLYINGRLDREVATYYAFRPVDGEPFEGYYHTFMPRNSVLRVADESIGAIVDEVMFWNEDLSVEEIRRFMQYGLDAADITSGLAPIEPLPEFAVDPGKDRQRLISYLTFDGELEMPFVPDRANVEMDYRILPLPTLSEIITPSTPPIVVDRIRTYERQLRGYFAAFDGGEHLENYMERNDYSYAGLLRGGVVFAEQDRETVVHLETDSSGEGLPDWWKTMYGLDVGSSEGDHGRYGDPDGDGLPNIAEFWAGTDPLNWDTYEDGFSDYDSIGPGQILTWGQLYTDWDGMADAWEAQYPDILSPLAYDAHLDPDGDGWSNFAEFMAGTDPSDVGSFPRPIMNVRFKYDGPFTQGPLRVLLYDRPSMDGVPVAIAAAGASQSVALNTVGQVAPSGQTASGTLPNTPVVPGTVTVEAPRSNGITFMDMGNGVLRSLDVSPIRFGQVNYDTGAWSVDLAPSIFSAGAPCSADWNYFTGVSSYPFDGVLAVVEGHLREGNHWAFAFIDRAGTGEWDPGDPAGLAQGQPINVSWGDIPTVTFGLTDELPGYPRFKWDPIDGVNTYTVQVSKVSSDGAPIVMKVTNRIRNYIHENDYLRSGDLGIPADESSRPGYRWNVNYGAWSSVFTLDWQQSLSRPVAQQPQGTVRRARIEAVWTMDEPVSRVRLQIRSGNSSGPVVLNAVIPAPFRDKNGVVRYDWSNLGVYAGDARLPNGNYVWRVQAINPRRSSEASEWRSFTVDLSDTAPAYHSISGAVHYFGMAPTDEIIVQAFRSAGFSGRPEAQVTLTGPGPYTLHGLSAGTYYVRAFINQNPATLQPWESWGFVKDYEYGSDYEVKPITVPGNRSGQDLVIRDRDTTQNGIPDALEYALTGELGTLNRAVWESMLNGMRDTSGDGLTDAEKEALGLDPTRIDTHGDGIPDILRLVLGLDPADPTQIPAVAHLFELLAVDIRPEGDLVEYDFVPGVAGITTNVAVRLWYTENLLEPFKPLTGSQRVLSPADVGQGPFDYMNHAPYPGPAADPGLRFYQLDWKVD